mmetsp:Transcript_15747/g.51334  ORF Transcript_15747/g.51334 Transcript_15747/m.51334 type:complete len:202 (-) Transcript_15747:419-1024(-)
MWRYGERWERSSASRRYEPRSVRAAPPSWASRHCGLVRHSSDDRTCRHCVSLSSYRDRSSSASGSSSSPRVRYCGGRVPGGVPWYPTPTVPEPKARCAAPRAAGSDGHRNAAAAAASRRTCRLRRTSSTACWRRWTRASCGSRSTTPSMGCATTSLRSTSATSASTRSSSPSASTHASACSTTPPAPQTRRTSPPTSRSRG